MTPKVFISYRRDDSGDIVGRIFDYLVQPIGPFEPDAIFRDVDSIPFGVNFKDYLHSAVSECQVMLLVIGPKWLDITDETGQRRLDSPRDFVRVEIESALQQRIPIIPLLVMNAQMPPEERLPAGLGELGYLNAIPIRRDPDFKRDIQKLIEAVTYWLKVTPETRKSTAANKPILITYHPGNISAKSAATK
ncbi:MAG TPA: toll/interleukin-1 receptor domain-containing protein [Phototrophicaceae bacterium]|nr:toll/interleukin-1 receptor domain-containing protein [Phototrophicaceae bacterium]